MSNFKKSKRNDELQRAVSYLNNSDEPLDSKLNAIQKSVEAGGFTMEEVLSAYAGSLARSGVIYPMEESQIREIHREAKRKTDTESIGNLTAVCSPNSLLETADDVITETISIYADDSVSVSTRQNRIKSLVNDARRDGISVSDEDVVRAIEEFKNTTQEPTNTEEASDSVPVDVADVEIATGIETPEEVVEGNEYVYRVETTDDATVTDIEWYIGGTVAGSGETMLHTFEHAGVYTVSAELVNADGQTDHTTEQIEVSTSSKVELNIEGETDLTTGQSVSYTADVQTQNETVKSLAWELNEEPVGSGKLFDHTFGEVGAHTLTLTAEGESGITSTVSEAIHVSTLTGVDVSVNAPDTAVTGETTTINCSINVENAYIEETTCKVGNDVIDVEERTTFEFEYTFTESGSQPITVTSVTNTGDSDTAGETVTVYTNPAVSITTELEEVVQGDVRSIEIEADDSLDVGWGVNNASLTEVGTKTAEVTFNSEIADSAEIEVKATNENGDSETESLTVDISKPELTGVISAPESIVTGDVTKLSTTESTVSHTEITRVEWHKNGDVAMGNGQTITHEFTSPGEYAISATIHADRGLTDTVQESIRVEPETDVTPVIVTKGGPTTHDEFKITAAKSVATNTSISAFSWEVESVGRFEAEAKEVSFDAPGDYEVELTVETAAGDTDTETAIISVDQYTSVDAVVSGPEQVTVGERTQFDTAGTKPVNTSVTGYEWTLNGQPVGTGEEFNQTFSSPGYYAVEVTATTATGDTDTDTASVVVERSDATVDAELSVRGPNRPTVGTPTVVTAQQTTVEDGTINKFLWEVDGQEIAETVHTIQSTTDEYGVSHITVTAIAEDGTEDTDSIDVYTSPQLNNPPYDELNDDDVTTADVLSEATNIYQDDELSDGDKDRFVAHLLVDAELNDVDLSPEDITGHIADIPPLSDVTPDINLEDARDQRDGRFDEVDDSVGATTAPAQDAVRGATHSTTQAKLEADDNSPDEGWDTETTEDVRQRQEEEYSIDEEGQQGANANLTEDGQEETDEAHKGGETGGNSSEGWDLGGGDTTEESDPAKEEIDRKDATEFEVTDAAATTESESPTIETPQDDLGPTEAQGTTGDSAASASEPQSGGRPDHEQPGYRAQDEHERERTTGTQDGLSQDESGLSTEQAAEEYKEELLGEETDLDEAREEVTDADKTERVSPESYDLGDSVLSMPNYSQDLLNFEYIFNKDDELLPEGVNGAGVVVTDEDDYVAIARVEGRDWSIHTEKKKQDIVNTYKSHVLSSLDNPVQILSVPTRFDIRNHVDQVNDVLDDNADSENELLMNIGRTIYPNWIEDFMTQNEMNERQFYIVLSISAEQLHEFKSSSSSITGKLAETPLVGDLFERFTSEKGDDITPYQILRELNTRMGRLESNFRRMDVTLDRVDERDEAMAVLYHYCHNTEPERDVFPTGPFTTQKQDAKVNGMDVQHLVDGHEPARDNSD